MTKLSVNLNKVALLRNQRDVGYPCVIKTAEMVLKAGAQGITVHPRPDERHIRKKDVPEIAAFLKEWPDQGIEFNIEGYPAEDFITLVTSHKCDQVTLVPDAPDQKTSDHGWDISKHKDFLTDVIGRIKDSGPRVSIFVDHDPDMAARAAETGADRVELYTGPYAFEQDLIGTYVQTAKAALDAGLAINAGHDLTLDNLGPFLEAIPQCAEVSIGHAITSDALDMGWTQATIAYLDVIRKAQGA